MRPQIRGPENEGKVKIRVPRCPGRSPELGPLDPISGGSAARDHSESPCADEDVRGPLPPHGGSDQMCVSGNPRPQSVVHLAVSYKPHAATPCSIAKPLNSFEILVGGTGFEPVTPAV